MQMHIRRSAERGHANHGWLDSHHSFSFANYYDRAHMGFGHLRVINQDVVAAGRGFGTHPHRDMEIISYVFDGAMEHKDSSGGGSVIRPGEVQLMSAGRGVTHSEFNHSKADILQFLQIWVLPRERGGPASYQQRPFPAGDTAMTHLVSPDGAGDSLRIKQDMDLWRVTLGDAQATTHSISRDRAWVQIVRGTLDVNGARLFAGDGLGIEAAGALKMHAHGDVEALIFDLA